MVFDSQAIYWFLISTAAVCMFEFLQAILTADMADMALVEYKRQQWFPTMFLKSREELQIPKLDFWGAKDFMAWTLAFRSSKVRWPCTWKDLLKTHSDRFDVLCFSQENHLALRLDLSRILKGLHILFVQALLNHHRIDLADRLVIFHGCFIFSIVPPVLIVLIATMAIGSVSPKTHPNLRTIFFSISPRPRTSVTFPFSLCMTLVEFSFSWILLCWATSSSHTAATVISPLIAVTVPISNWSSGEMPEFCRICSASIGSGNFSSPSRSVIIAYQVCRLRKYDGMLSPDWRLRMPPCCAPTWYRSLASCLLRGWKFVHVKTTLYL